MSEMKEDKEELFQNAAGLPANVHAKKLAKEKSAKAKVKKEDAFTFYTKSGQKVLKFIAKPGKLFSIYVGNVKKHGESLESFIKKWKDQGLWLTDISIIKSAKEEGQWHKMLEEMKANHAAWLKKQEEKKAKKGE